MNGCARFLAATTAAAMLTVSALNGQGASGTSSSSASAPNLRNAVPPNLGAGQFYAGAPWTGAPGVTATVAELMAREATQPSPQSVRVVHRAGRSSRTPSDNAVPSVAG